MTDNAPTETPYIYKENQVLRTVAQYKQSPSLETFLQDLRIEIIEKNENTLKFDLKNANAPLANAIRRILIAEVETYAFHNVFVYENDSVFPDEYLANRLGLIPIRLEDNDDESLKEHLFELNEDNKDTENITVYSNDIKSVPENCHIQPNVVICKLAPGNKINIKMQISRGTGAQHAKWSPVSLCSYRLMPRITLKREFMGEDALKLKECFPLGVIEIENDKALVKDPRKDTVSREAVRIFGEEAVELGREPNWFCFSLETLMEYPVEILKRGLIKLKDKCEDLRNEIENYEVDHEL